VTAFVGSCFAVAPLFWGKLVDDQSVQGIRTSGFLIVFVIASGIAPFLLLAWLIDKGFMPRAFGLGMIAPVGASLVPAQYAGLGDSSSTAILTFPLGGILGLVIVFAGWLLYEVGTACLAAFRGRNARLD
jgi:hypothetical protein